MHDFVKKLYKPLYSRTFYLEDSAAGKGVGFTLLAIAAVLNILVFGILAYGPVQKFYETELPATISQMPTITVLNGQISIDKPLPYSVALPYMGDKIGGNVTFSESSDLSLAELGRWMEESGTGILVMPTMLVVKDNGQLRVVSMNNAKNSVTTREKMTQYAATLQSWTWPVIVIGGVIAIWLVFILQSLAFSLLGIVLNAVFKTDQEYSVILRFTSYALWDTELVWVVLQLARIHMTSGPYFLLLAAFMVYIFFALQGARKA